MNMFLHYAGCPVWTAEPFPRCSCPRLWRVRKDRAPSGLRDAYYCWVIQRRTDTGQYVAMMRAHSLDRALSVVDTLTTVADRFARRTLA